MADFDSTDNHIDSDMEDQSTLKGSQPSQISSGNPQLSALTV